MGVPDHLGVRLALSGSPLGPDSPSAWLGLRRGWFSMTDSETFYEGLKKILGRGWVKATSFKRFQDIMIVVITQPWSFFTSFVFLMPLKSRKMPLF